MQSEGPGLYCTVSNARVERREHRLAAELRYGNLTTVSGPRVNPEVEKERLQLRRAFLSGRLLTARTF
jgi:hypothetical protein